MTWEEVNTKWFVPKKRVSKLGAVILATVFMPIPMHLCYLGKNRAQALTILLSICSCGVYGWCVAVMDIIAILTMNPRTFDEVFNTGEPPNDWYCVAAVKYNKTAKILNSLEKAGIEAAAAKDYVMGYELLSQVFAAEHHTRAPNTVGAYIDCLVATGRTAEATRLCYEVIIAKPMADIRVFVPQSVDLILQCKSELMGVRGSFDPTKNQTCA